MDARNSSRSGHSPEHPHLSRRAAVQAGAIGLLGLGVNHLEALRAMGAGEGRGASAAPDDLPHSGVRLVSKARSVIYIFLSGGLSQLESSTSSQVLPRKCVESFDRSPRKRLESRSANICLRLAERSHLWALVRSLTHGTNDHSVGHNIMLTGRSDLPSGFNPNGPRPGDWPSIAAVAGALTRPRHNLPPAVVLPETLVHNTGRIIPGQFAGLMGPGATPGSSRPLPSTRPATAPTRLSTSITRSVNSPPKPNDSRHRAWACPRGFLARGSPGECRCCNASIASVARLTT